MSYTYRRIDIRIFDFHLTLDPLVDTSSLNPAAEFLGDPAKYKKAFEAQPAMVGTYRVRPLDEKSRAHHIFWKYYAATFGGFDPWKSLVPFICEPTKHRLSVIEPRQGIRVFARPNIYLFPFGWSTSIEMSLHSERMTAAEIRDFMGGIRTQASGPFQVNGKGMALSAVLRSYGDELKKACFKKGTAAVDLRRVDRQILMGVTRFDGNVLFYKPWNQGDPPMPAAEKAAIHEMLRGEPVSPTWVVAAETDPQAKGNFLLTRFADAGFAITYFDIGTLLFPQLRKGHYAQGLSCLAANNMACQMVVQALQSFYDFPQSAGGAPDSILTKTRESARRRVVELPQQYKSALMSNWCKFYSPVQKLISEDQKSTTGDGKKDKSG